MFAYNYYSKTVLRLVAGSGSDVTEATTKHEAVISMGILGWALMNNPNNTIPSMAPTLATLSNIPLAVDLQYKINSSHVQSHIGKETSM